MEQFHTIGEVMASDFPLLAEGYSERKRTDRVLKSTKIEQAIYEDLHADADGLSECEAKGGQKLKSFPSLVNDVFQSVYGLEPKYLEDSDVSALSKRFNKSILDSLISDENYSAVKSVCEGKEIPAIGATEEFSEQLLDNLDMLMKSATGGNGKPDALERMEQDRNSLMEQFAELMERREQTPEEKRDSIERKILNTANRVLSKQEQSEMYERLIAENMRKNTGVLRTVVSAAAGSALERAKETERAILSWGSGTGDMKKNPVNMEILKRTAASNKLRYIAQFLGRYREMLKSKRLAGYTYGRGEKYDIEYGNNIAKALTSELSMLARPELIPLFIRKYQHKALKQYRKREPEYKGKGDIIVCLDESGSTFGENNAYGMAVAMVLYEICRVNNSNFALVHFAADTRVDYFPKKETADAKTVMDCAETFLNGGTNFEKSLYEVISLTESGKLDKPDIVFVTDGCCNVSDECLSRFQQFKADTGAKLTGVLLDKGDCFEFSLAKFADCVYRTSELLGDTIVENLIEERI